MKRVPRGGAMIADLEKCVLFGFLDDLKLKVSSLELKYGEREAA